MPLPGVAVGLGVLGLLLWLTWGWLFGTIEYAVPSERVSIHGAESPYRVLLPLPLRLDGGEPRLRVLEDGRPLERVAPEAPSPRPRVGDGRFAVQVTQGGRVARVFFTPTDGSDPRTNGRTYALRHARRPAAAAAVLVAVCWLLLAGGLWLLWRGGATTPARQGRALGMGGWGVVGIVAVYSLLALQARGGLRWSVPWLLVTAGLCVVLLAAKTRRPEPGRIAEWSLSASPWLGSIAGLAVWAWATVLLEASDHAWRTGLLHASAAAAGGLLVLLAFRRELVVGGSARAWPLVALFCGVACLELARQAGFDWAGTLWSIRLNSHPPELFGQWTTKFAGQWLLVLAWCSVLALALEGGSRLHVGAPAVLGFAGIVLTFTYWAGTTTGLGTWILSVAVAAIGLWSPRRVRRGLLALAVLGVLLVPLLAPVAGDLRPWLRSVGLLRWINATVRTRIWEHASELIALRPVSGWGFGGSSGFTDPAIMPGGHPHNFALLTWLDLGVVGAVLLAGLLVAIVCQLRPFETDPPVHAALIGLLVVHLATFASNYEAWQPIFLSLLWMTAALAAAVLPAPAHDSRKRSPRLALLAVGTVLVLGVAWLATVRAERHAVSRRFSAESVSFDSQSSTLSTEGREWHVPSDPNISARLRPRESADGQTLRLHGCVYDPEAERWPEPVLVFVGEDLAGVDWPGLPCPELFWELGGDDIRAFTAGIEISHSHAGALDLGSEVTLVTFRDGVPYGVRLPPLARRR